ncbi:MAG: hypothetical protein ACE5J2_04730 [Nitrososphaerales archaeon]
MLLSLSHIAIAKLQFLILTLIISQAHGVTIVQIGDSAGLPYPDVEQINVFLKEAYIQIDTTSEWKRSASGFEPLNQIKMEMHARYLIQNDAGIVDLPIKIPLQTHLLENSLSFTFNAITQNHTSVEYANPRKSGTGLHLYTLDLDLPGGVSTIEVNAISAGVGSSEIDFTILTDASKWSKPIEKLVISTQHANGLITGYSIQPDKTTLKAATWEFNNVRPTQDLTVSWKTDPPRGTDMTDVAGAQPSSPSIPPIIALVAGGAIIGFIAYIRVKRRRAKSVN